MACKGTCVAKYGAREAVGGIGTRGGYLDGRKRCQTCCVWIRWDGHRCPCCGTMLRTRRAKVPGGRLVVARY